MEFKLRKGVLLNSGDLESKKSEIREYFLETFSLEESLYSLLKNDDAFYQRPETLRHPLVFYFGHTCTFFVNKLYIGKFIPKRINPKMESMLAIGVDEMSWDDLNEDHYDWPSIENLREYRQEVKNLVLNYIDEVDFSLPIDWKSPIWPVLMGIEHMNIHIETSSVLIRQLPLEWVQQSEQWAPCQKTGKAPENRLIKISGGTVTLGKELNDKLYGWDNEYGSHKSKLRDFSASEYLVSNQEFLQFIEDGGYQKDQYWTKEGQEWKAFTKASHPTFWKEHQGGYLLRTLEREIDLPMNWPVDVNYLEAKAFCSWKGEKLNKDIRLPSEDEWTLFYQSENVEHISTWEKAPGNINLEQYASSCPVNEFKFNKFYDVIGNVWQWTETPIYPFDGFKVHDLYDDFTVPTFDKKHNLMKGGSWVSTGNEANMDSRYAFRRHFFQHAGFRYMQSDNTIVIDDNAYETDTLLSQYCEFHYGDEYFNVPNFPKACVEVCSQYFEQLPAMGRALDLGCAVGRSTLELGKHFDHVTGLDFSARFINKAQRLLDKGNLRYTLTSEGDIQDFFERDLVQLGLSELKGEVEFYQADACNLPSKYSNYDLIFAGNLIDRLHSPRSFLHSIANHLNPGGVLILTSPYTWLEEYTPKSEWIGGYKRDGENLTTLQGLQEELAPWFDMIGGPTAVPFVIRETKRKFQHTLSELSVWKKI